jgi:hypothetical protein
MQRTVLPSRHAFPDQWTMAKRTKKLWPRELEQALVSDAFAGPGVYQGEEPGSPLIMLDALLRRKDRDELKATFRVRVWRARPHLSFNRRGGYSASTRS